MLELKVPIIGASVGFVLSFLVGLVGSATFSAVILRAFIMAILFGLLAFAVRAVVKRYLPELLEENVSDASVAESTGKVVDITVGEHQGDAFPFDDSANADINSMVPDFLEPDSHETVTAAGSAPSAGVRKGESAEPTMQAGNAQSRDADRSETPAFTGGLDVLPDLQDFAPQKKTEGGDDQEADTFQVDSGLGSGDSVFVTPDADTMSAETETMAKAIRTILSRDAT